MLLFVVGFAAGLLAAAAFGYARRPRHRHDWQVLDVGHASYVMFGGDVTVVRARCRDDGCGKVDEFRHDGLIRPHAIEAMYA